MMPQTPIILPKSPIFSAISPKVRQAMTTTLNSRLRLSALHLTRAFGLIMAGRAHD